MATAEDRIARYELAATAADLKGFRHLAPAGGVDGTSAAYFFELRCTRCGEVTMKDVCLHPPGPELIASRMAPCSYRVRSSSSSRFVRANCFPTCANPGHLVRKCKECGLLGSVELIPGTGSPITTGTNVLMTLACIGYTPMNFWPGTEWTAITMDGGEVEVELTDDTFGTDDGTDNTFSIKGVKFVLRGAK